MTILGLSCTSEIGRVWVDTLTFSERQPLRYTPKLAVNAVAGVVGAACGWAQLTERFRMEVTKALSLDHLLVALPSALRRASADLADRRPDPETFIKNSAVICGFSNRYQRLMGYVLDAEAFFAPEPVTTFASPAVPELDGLEALSFDDVRFIARHQADDLAQHMGQQITGEIFAATVTPHGIDARKILDLSKAISND